MSGGRVLVTGGAGFVGARVAERFRASGWSVTTVDRRGADLNGDLGDAAFVSSLPDTDVLVHTAAVQYVSKDLPMLHREPWFHHNNVVATGLLAKRYGDSVDYFLNIGTSMMFDQLQPGPYGEGSPMAGQGVYSRSKLAAYRSLDGAVSAPHVTVVPCIIGGEGREGLFRGFVTTMRRWGFAVLPGKGTWTTHVVHVDDFAALIELLVDRRATGLVAAGGPDPMSIRDWIGVIQDELGLEKVRIVQVPYAVVRLAGWATRYRAIAREQLVMLGRDHVVDTDKAATLGWQPTRSNERIVRDIARYIGAPAR
jgi:nucleoside-diphosphate-sugar epimerase